VTKYPEAKPAVLTAITILQTAVGSTDVGVGSKMPKMWPMAYIRVTRAGGGIANLVTDDARILAEIYGASIGIVEPLTAQAITALRDAEGTSVNGIFVRGFNNIEGPVDHPHVDVPDMCRWQFQGTLLVSTS
jgi:hypothetical protein